MYAVNDNHQSTQCQRFMDLSDEPLIMMAPIKGYDKMPLVPLEKAIQDLIPYIPGIEQMAYIAKERCPKPPPDRLSEDQSAAIMLYTLEWEPKEESVYFKLNKALREPDRQALKPWLLYLKLLFSALSLLPSSSCTVYRGVKLDLKHRYKKGQKIVWWGFSSCTSSMDVLNNEAFMGTAGKRTLFAVECQSGKDIQQHSYFKRENEFLLPAAREFEIISVFPQADGLNIIQLKEVQPKYPLLETSSTISQIVQSFPPPQSNPVTLTTSAQPISSQPVYQQPAQTSQNQLYYAQTHNSTQQEHIVPIYSNNIRKSHSCSWYFLITCGFIFCCPCTACYLCYKKSKSK